MPSGVRTTARWGSCLQRRPNAIITLTHCCLMKAVCAGLLLCCLSIQARELALVELSGPPYERGFKHGRALKAQIGKSIAIWKKALHDRTRRNPESFDR